MHEFMRFCAVGGVAFMVDAGVLELLIALEMPALAARVFSIAVALQCSYLLHGAFTYRTHHGYSIQSWRLFMTSNLLGAAINYAVFAGVLGAALGPDAESSRWIALVAGTGVALFFNHWANRRFAFARKEP